MATEAAAASAEALLRNVHGTFPLSKDKETFIGTDERRCAVILNSAVCDASHARLFFSNKHNAYVINDLRSRNGTFVNGVGVKEGVILSDRDTLRFGSDPGTFRFEINQNQTSEPSAPRSPSPVRDRLPSRRGSTANAQPRKEHRGGRPKKSVAWRAEGEEGGGRELPARPRSGRAVSVRQVFRSSGTHDERDFGVVETEYMLDPDPRWLTHSYGHTPEDSIEVPSTRRRNRSPSPPPRDQSPSPLRRAASPLRRAKVRRPSRQDEAPLPSPRRSMPRPPTGSRPSHDARHRRRGALLDESTESGASPSTPSRNPTRTPTAKGRRGSRTYNDEGDSSASGSGTSSPATSPHLRRRRRSHTRNGQDTVVADGSQSHSHALHEAPATAATAIEIEAAGARVKRHINNASSHSQDSDLHRAKDLCETLGRKTGKALAAMRDIFHKLEVAVPKHLIHALNAIDSADTLSGADAKDVVEILGACTSSASAMAVALPTLQRGMDDYIARQASRHTAVDDKLTSAQARTRELEDAVEDLTAQLQETAAARRELEHQFRQAKRKWEERRAELETLRSGVEEEQARWSEAQASVERELRETQARLQTARLETRASEEGRRSAEGEAAQGRRDLEAMESRARRLEVHKQEAEEALEAEREKHAIRVAELVEEKERGAQHCQLLLGRLGDEESKRQAATSDLSTAREQLTVIKAELEEAQRRLKSQEGQLQRLQEVEEDLGVRQREGAQLQGRVLELEERNNALQAALTAVSAEGGVKAHDKARAEDLESRLKAAFAAEERTQYQHKEELAALQTQLADARVAWSAKESNLREDLTRLTTALERKHDSPDTKQKLLQLEQDKAALTAQLERARSELAAERLGLQEQLSQSETTWSTQEAALRDELARANGDLLRAKADLVAAGSEQEAQQEAFDALQKELALLSARLDIGRNRGTTDSPEYETLNVQHTECLRCLQEAEARGEAQAAQLAVAVESASTIQERLAAVEAAHRSTQQIAEETKAKLSREQADRQKAEALFNDIATSLGCQGISNSVVLQQDITRLCQAASDERQGRLVADVALAEARTALAAAQLRSEPEDAGAREGELAMLDAKLASLEAMAGAAAEALTKADARRAELEAHALEYEVTLQSQAVERDILIQGKLAAERRAQAAGQIAAEVQAAMGRLQTRFDEAANRLAAVAQVVLKQGGETQSVNDSEGQEASSNLQPMDALERELAQLQAVASSLSPAADLTNSRQLAELAELMKEVKEQRGLAERALQETERLAEALKTMERRAMTAEAELTRKALPADAAGSRDAAIQAACESISSLEQKAAALTEALEAERQQATILVEKERQKSVAAVERAEQQAATALERGRLEAATAAENKQQAAIRAVQDDLAAVRSERDELQKEVARMTDAHDDLQATCSTHTVALQETQQRLAAEVAARVDTNAAFDQMKRDLEAFRACGENSDRATSLADESAHQQEADDMVEQLRAQVAQLERAVQRVPANQPDMEGAATADAAAAAAAASLAEREARAAKEAALRAATVAGKAQAVAEARASAAAAEAERARAEQISLASELRGAQAELNDAVTRASSAEARVVELTERTGQLRSQLRDIQGEVARWREDASDVGTTRNRALAAEQRLDEAQAALDVLSAERSRLVQELTRARDDAESCRRQEEEATRKLRQANAELVAQTKALDAARAELHRRDEAAATSKAKETMEGKTEQARIKRLKAELAEVHVLLKEALTGVGQETTAGATVGALCKQTGARLQQLDLNVRMLQRELSEAKATRGST